HEDAEVVAAQVAGLELVAVPAGAQDAQVVAVEGAEACFAGGGDGHPLPGDGVAVLEAGGADLAGGDVEEAGELADEVLGAHAALLHPQVEVIALAGGLVGGDL